MNYVVCGPKGPVYIENCGGFLLGPQRTRPCSGCGSIMMKNLITSLGVKQDFLPQRPISFYMSGVSVWFQKSQKQHVISVCTLTDTSMHKSQNRLLISSRERELDYFSLMPFVWRKRCWLTAEFLDPTQPGFNADAWLMRSTTGIIIRQGILVFSCVSQGGQTSQRCGVKVRFSASDWFIFTVQQLRAMSQRPQGGFKTSQACDS